ncbi:Repressor ROX1 [Leucoagaricus sp. SymC.cos]|nr:Repressor ROX1 [Leucoagaricus sp. SymC.cos]
MSDLPNGAESSHFPFTPHPPESHGFSSTPLVDYSLFDTPVDISLGVLPPRPTSSRAFAQGRIPRPRNAFMLFRSAFHRERRLTKAVEKDHRHISRIIGLCWAELSEAEKDVWRQKAELEKQQHALAYPDYRFKPTPRTKPPMKRNVKRNSPKEIERCHKIARLLQDGKSGEELTHAVGRMEGDQPFVMLPGESTACNEREERNERHKKSDHTRPTTNERPQGVYISSGLPPGYHYLPALDPPPFRSPLLPPADFSQLPSKRSNPVGKSDFGKHL